MQIIKPYHVKALSLKDGILEGDYTTFEEAEAVARNSARSQYSKDIAITKVVGHVTLPDEHFKTTHIS